MIDIGTHELAEIGERIDQDGPAAHHRLLQHVAALVAELAPGAAAALADISAPDVVRQRALSLASATLLRQPMRVRTGFCLAV